MSSYTWVRMVGDILPRVERTALLAWCGQLANLSGKACHSCREAQTLLRGEAVSRSSLGRTAVLFLFCTYLNKQNQSCRGERRRLCTSKGKEFRRAGWKVSCSCGSGRAIALPALTSQRPSNAGQQRLPSCHHKVRQLAFAHRTVSSQSSSAAARLPLTPVRTGEGP